MNDRSIPWLGRLFGLVRAARRALDALQPLALLGARLYVAQVFWLSGLTKIRDWDVTRTLFAEDYHVPLLPPDVAAVLGTAGELGLPVLLVIGLGGRFAALGLSVVNAVAVASVPEMPEAAFMLHVLWGSLLGAVAVFGPGAWSVDALLPGGESERNDARSG